MCIAFWQNTSGFKNETKRSFQEAYIFDVGIGYLILLRFFRNIAEQYQVKGRGIELQLFCSKKKIINEILFSIAGK